MPKTYTTSQGDAWDLISFKVYGSEKYMDLLIEKNWEHRKKVFFGSGIVLQIPDVSQQEQDNRNLPPWRR